MSYPDDGPARALTHEQEVKRLRDLLSWVQDNARCLETRRIVAARLRELDAEIAGVKMNEPRPSGDRRP